MKEYIERQKLFDALPDVKEDKQITLYGAVADFMVIASSIPSADVVEVKHGYWTAHPASYECSVCENEFSVEGYAEDYDAIEDWDLHYCPNCGAKMDGERKEQE